MRRGTLDGQSLGITTVLVATQAAHSASQKRKWGTEEDENNGPGWHLQAGRFLLGESWATGRRSPYA